MTVFRTRNTERARELRNAASPAERLLWRHLGGRRLGGYKFSRQMPVGDYFADFLCRECGLIIEVDGYSHDVRIEQDQRRTESLKKLGFTVIRFTNADVTERLEGVLLEILQALSRLIPHPQPLAQAGGELF